MYKRQVLNAAARVTCLSPKFAHITPVLRELHWLPVKFRVEFKIALLVFTTLNGLAPQYLSELLVVKPRTRYSLRSDSETLLVIPKVTRKTFGDQVFFHAGPTVWNALPSSLRNCMNIDSFKVQLKTYLFKKAFNLQFNLLITIMISFHLLYIYIYFLVHIVKRFSIF